MAVEVGSAYITLLPSMRGFSTKAQAELSAAGLGASFGRAVETEAAAAGGRAGQSFTRSFGRTSGGSGVYVAGLIRNLRTYGFALSGITGLTVGFGLKTASSMQQAQVAFTTMLGSAKEARAFLGELVTFARKTPFDLPGVVSASQKLLAFGFTARQVKPLLTAIGDAAAGLSLGTEGLDRLTTAIGQIQAKGKLQSDELLQLTEAGVPALRILANEFHLTTAKVQELVTKGLVPSSKAIPALLHGLENGTKGLAGETAKFGGLMQKQSHTLGGLFSNLKDTVSQGLARAVKPLVPVLERAIPGAMRTLNHAFRQAAVDMRGFLVGLGLVRDRTPGAASGFEKFGAAALKVAHGIRAAFEFIRAHIDVFTGLAVAVGGAVVAFKSFQIALQIAGPIKNLVIVMGRLVGAQWALNAAMDANPIGIIVTALGALAAGLIYAYKKSETFRKIVQGAFVAVATFVGRWAQAVITEFKIVLSVWFAVAGKILDVAVALFGHKIFGPLDGMVRGAQAKFGQLRDSVVSTLGDAANKAGQLGTAAGELFADNLVSAAVDRVAASPGMRRLGIDQAPIASSTKKTADTVKKLSGPVFADVGTSLGSSLGDGIAKGTKSAASKVQKSAKDLLDKILGPLRTLRQKAQQMASSIAQAITGDTGFAALQGQTDSFGSPMATTLRSVLTGLAAQKRDVLKFRRQLRQLGKRGLSDAAIREIAGEGLTQGGAFASTLMDATRKQLRRISALRHDVNAGAQGIGVDAARDRFGGQIGRELVRAMHAVEKAQHRTDLSQKTIHEITAGFGRELRRDRKYVDLSDTDRRNARRVLAHG